MPCRSRVDVQPEVDPQVSMHQGGGTRVQAGSAQRPGARAVGAAAAGLGVRIGRSGAEKGMLHHVSTTWVSPPQCQVRSLADAMGSSRGVHPQA